MAYFFIEGAMGWLGVAIAAIALIDLLLPDTKKWFFQC
jgi:hypothetical protein